MDGFIGKSSDCNPMTEEKSIQSFEKEFNTKASDGDLIRLVESQWIVTKDLANAILELR